MRPQIKVNDRVKLRQDGEIGELNKSELSNNAMDSFVSADDVADDKIYIECVDKWYPMLRFDICNDFSDVQVGDEVEIYYNDTNEIVVEKVVSISKTRFKTSECITCSGFDFDGKHYFGKGDREYSITALRIAKKAPLLANAKVGDLVLLQRGGWKQIESIDGGCAGYPYIIFGHAFDVNGKGVNDDEIIEHQSLAPEGSAEWAWQMMLLGKKVNQADSSAEYYDLFDGECYPHYKCTASNIARFSNKLPYCKELPYRYKNGWQLYEAPKFGVGQWVKFSTPAGDGYGVITGKKDMLWAITELNGYGSRWELCDSDFVTVKARDVILNFHNGIKGRIAKGKWGFAVLDEHNDWIAEIDIDSLTEPMQTTVKALLARQEVEG